MLGRPTAYKEEYPEQARKLCEFGATNAELADFFGVSTQTIHNWMVQHPEFLDSIKAGKTIADDRVERSLYEKAVGYSFDAVKFFNHEGNIISQSYREHMPPDNTSMIFWLKNRRPDLWRDKTEQDVTLKNPKVTRHDLTGRTDHA